MKLLQEILHMENLVTATKTYPYSTS